MALSDLNFSQALKSNENKAEDYNQLSQKVDELFAPLDKKDSPGCAVGIVKDGKVIYKRGFGMANLDYDLPISSETVFNVASMSKQFTAMSIALLVQQGKISLNDNIRKYIPEIPEYGFPITIRHLIYHTSGIRDYTELIELSNDRIENIHTDADILNILARQKQLNFNPGERHIYNNSGYVLLGIIVERVSGKTLSTFQKEFVFEPLGMKNTLLYDDRSMIVKNRATGYFSGENGKFRTRASLWDRVGDGGLLTTVEDLFLWDDNFYNTKLGTPELIEQLTTPGKLNNNQRIDYAFGLEPISYKGLPVIMHGGRIRGFRAQMYRFPEQNFLAICLCNNDAVSPTQKVEQIADIYLSSYFKQLKSPEKKVVPISVNPGNFKLSEKKLTRFVGLYASKYGETVRRLYVKDGKLWYFRSAGSENELSPTSLNRFVMLGVPDKVEVVFSDLKAGSPSRLSLLINETARTVYERVSAADQSPEQTRRYVGTYYSEELDTKYEIVAHQTKLLVQKKGGAEISLTPKFNDVYANIESLGTIRFIRQKGRGVVAFLLNTERAKGLHFKKL
jgi:CubicO group peptidase (beta-lactamase class C family)